MIDGDNTTSNRLLIVDDDLSFSDYLAEVCVSEGFDVSVAADSHEFLTMFDKFLPEVVIVDLMMPDVDGIEVLRELAARRTDANILVTSGFDLRTLKTAERLGIALGLNITDIIPKPARVADVRKILQKLDVAAPTVTDENLWRAIKEDHFHLLYQPKLDLKSGNLTGVEALIRWQSPSGTVLGPESFLPRVERDRSLSDSMTDWVLSHAIEQVTKWQGAGLSIELAINLSAMNLQDLSLPDRMSEICQRDGLPPESVTLELTETATMRGITKSMDVFTRLRLKGFKLSIDDFGTGYSSLVHLQRLPFSEVKIDKSFVMSMQQSTDSHTIIRAIINLAHTLGISVTAEGIETEFALEMLTDEKCDVAQGYLISRPLAKDQVADFAANWSMPSRSA